MLLAATFSCLWEACGRAKAHAACTCPLFSCFGRHAGGFWEETDQLATCRGLECVTDAKDWNVLQRRHGISTDKRQKTCMRHRSARWHKTGTRANQAAAVAHKTGSRRKQAAAEAHDSAECSCRRRGVNQWKARCSTTTDHARALTALSTSSPCAAARSVVAAAWRRLRRGLFAVCRCSAAQMRTRGGSWCSGCCSDIVTYSAQLHKINFSCNRGM